MRKLFLSVGCALALLWTSTVADAAIFVNISDGTNTVNGLALPLQGVPLMGTKGGLKLAWAAPLPTGTVDDTKVLNLLTCTTRPCTVFFPSGNTAPTAALSTDTFTLQDVSSTSRARVEKFDSGASADRVSLKGLKITSRVAGRVLTLTYGTQAGDLRTLTSTQATSYAATAAMSGSFKTSSSLRATACKAGTVSTDMDDASDSCLRLSLAINGTTVDGQGNTVSATVSVPCNNAFPTLNPCGTNGSWTGSLGSFIGVNDSKSISCPSTCSPVQVGTLVAKFNGANEVLQLTASAHGGMANVSDENGGVEETALALATEIGENRWVTFSAATERCRAEPKSPAINDTRNINNFSTLPISFELWCGILSPVAATQGIPLVSLGDTMLLPGAAGTRFEASRVAFLPAAGQLQLKNITSLSFNYDVAFGPEQNPIDGRLDPLSYSPCTGGSLRAEIQLLDSKGVDLGVLAIYLGTTDNGRSGCGVGLHFLQLVGDPLARVDLSGLKGNLTGTCCVTLAKAMSGQLGNFLVRKIAFIVSRPVSPAPDAEDPFFDNFKVTFLDGNVTGNGISVSAQSSLQEVTGVARTFDLSTNGVSIVITKLESPTASPLGVVKVVGSGEIVINGGKFTTSVNINDIQPEPGGLYGISLCPNGAETDFASPPLPDGDLTPGICIANQAKMRLL